MKDQSIPDIPGGVSLAEGSKSQVDIMLSGKMPADDLSRKQIHDNTEVIPLAVYLDIREITCPDEIRSLLVMEMIRAVTVRSVLASAWLNGRHLRQLRGIHQSVHSSNADVYAIVTSEDICDFIGPDALVVV